MDHTQRMIALLGRVRKQMNGAVAESMSADGENYGLNYGVSIATLREIAATEQRDHDFAKYLYQQQVRELRLLACHLAEPDKVDIHDFPYWARGIRNAELAEELAFALLSKIYDINSLMGIWTTESSELISYAALMAAAPEAVVLFMTAYADTEKAVRANPESLHIAQGVVALICYIATRDKSVRVGIPTLLESLPEGRAKSLIAEDLEWRLEYM